MKYAVLALSALLLWGCAVSHIAEKEGAATAAAPKADAPFETVALALDPSESPYAPQTPIPTPSPSFTPTPTPAATPTPSPNPYRAEKVTVHKENDAFWYGKLTEACKTRIIGTTFPQDPKDCPIKIDDLRYVAIQHFDFDGEEHSGELIVHKQVAGDVLDIFYRLYLARYPLTSVKLLDDYNEPFSDGTSMEENNTSAFCCRYVTGTHRFSRHSYGAAIDVNPMYNPYIRPDGSFAPESSAPYLDRSPRLPGMIDENDLCYKLFTQHGWKWGGHFTGETDYQHFYKKLK